jgi:hypothetical protein
MRRYWGSLNFLKPEWRDDPDNAPDFVVDSYKHGPSDFRVAFELLALADQLDLGQRLQRLLNTTYDRDTAVLEPGELDEVIAILGMVPEIARKSLVDENDRVPAGRIEQLKEHSTVIDFGSEVGHQPEDGVAEALSRVFGVRKALEDARTRGLDVSLN